MSNWFFNYKSSIFLGYHGLIIVLLLSHKGFRFIILTRSWWLLDLWNFWQKIWVFGPMGLWVLFSGFSGNMGFGSLRLLVQRTWSQAFWVPGALVYFRDFFPGDVWSWRRLVLGTTLNTVQFCGIYWLRYNMPRLRERNVLGSKDFWTQAL